MATMTVHGIDEQIACALKERAQKEDTSVNTVILKFSKSPSGWRRKNERYYMTILIIWPAPGARRMQPNLNGQLRRSKL